MSLAPLKIVPDPTLDLVLDRVIDVPRKLVWEAWTKPELLKEWFCPRPWGVSHCEIDLRPGGKFLTVMRSPEGQEFPNVGCYLEVVPEERLIWTAALQPGYRPIKNAEDPVLSAIVEMSDVPGGTRYVATALHADVAGRDMHIKMGFEEGWGAALEQLVELCRKRGG